MSINSTPPRQGRAGQGGARRLLLPTARHAYRGARRGGAGRRGAVCGDYCVSGSVRVGRRWCCYARLVSGKHTHTHTHIRTHTHTQTVGCEARDQNGLIDVELQRTNTGYELWVRVRVPRAGAVQWCRTSSTARQTPAAWFTNYWHSCASQ